MKCCDLHEKTRHERMIRTLPPRTFVSAIEWEDVATFVCVTYNNPQ